MLERFTERAGQVITFATDEAQALKHNHIGTEHILLGLLLQDEGLAARVLESMDITVEGVRAQVMRTVGQGREDSPSQIPLTPSAKQVIERALREALSLGHNYIHTEHILLALAAVEGVGGRILLDLGVEGATIRAETIRKIGPRPASHQSSLGGSSPNTTPAAVARASAMPAGDGVLRLFGIAADIARENGRNVIEPRDLLIALTRDRQTARLLAELGVDEAAARAAIEQAGASDSTLPPTA